MVQYTSEHAYKARCEVLARAMSASNQAIALQKSTSNLFRSRKQGMVTRIDVRLMNHVIDIDEKNLVLDVEGMTTYEDIVSETLQYDLMPPVVPQLKTITIGGGVSGLAIESSSWREGLTHESVLEMDVLTSSGKVVTCSPRQHADLFYAMPNSYGTLGYILRLKVPLRRVKPYVHLRHVRFHNAQAMILALDLIARTEQYDGEPVQFVDGMAMSDDELYLTIGTEVDAVPYTSDYTYMDMYWISITKRAEDYLTIHDYIWRWDTDWFWCSKNVGAAHPLMRRLLGRRWLGSKTYGWMMRFESKHRLVERVTTLIGKSESREVVIQDVQLPIERVTEFLEFFHEQIGIRPVWLCPTRALAIGSRWPWTLYPMVPDQLYVNVGFWDTRPTEFPPESGYYNRLIEKKVMAMNGTKSLYSDSYYSRPEFDKLYNHTEYTRIKRVYDPSRRFRDLYDKCVKKS